MAIVTVTFRRCLVNAPEYGSDDNHVGSRVFFDLHLEGREFVNVYVDVRQVTREGAEREPLIVTPPRGYDGPLDVHVFQSLVEFYYRHAVGGASGLFGGRGLGMRLTDWVIEQDVRVRFEVSGAETDSFPSTGEETSESDREDG